MPEHFTKLTVEARLWCKRCFRATMHRVDQGRRGPCLECVARADHSRIQRGRKDPQPDQLQFKF